MPKKPGHQTHVAPKESERSEPDEGATSTSNTLASPHAKPKKRTFPAEYKLAILEEADQATEPGQITLLLRREGLYSSHLTNWRKWRARLEKGLHSPRTNNPSQTALRRDNERLQRQNQRLQRKLKQANLLIDLQKKLNQTMAEFDELDGDGNEP